MKSIILSGSISAFLLVSPAAQAQVESNFAAGGGVKIGWSETTCDSGIEGAIRYNSAGNATVDYCNGTAWQMVGAGATTSPVLPDRGIQFNSGGNLAASTEMTFSSSGSFIISGTHTGIPDPAAFVSGSHMFFDTRLSAFRAGWRNTPESSIGPYSIAMGMNTSSTGSAGIALGMTAGANHTGAIAIGNNSSANGLNSIAIGPLAATGGSRSIALGYWSNASGDDAIAIGYNANASGNNAFAAGREVRAQGNGSFAFGLTTADITADPRVSGARSFGIFMGNQNNVNFSASNTMGLFGGKFIIDHRIPATKLSADTTLEIAGTLKIGNGGEACDAARKGSLRYLTASDTFEICATAGNWTILNGGNAAGSDTQIQFNSGGTALAASSKLTWNDVSGKLTVTGDIEYTGVTVDISDQRLKSDIVPLPPALTQIMAMTPVSFTMKDDPVKEKEYGFIAQDIEKIYPALVKTANDEEQTKSMNYIGLIAPLVKALQEQQDIIAEQQKRLEALEKAIAQ